MAHRNLDVVEGWTGRLDWQLLSCGAPLALTTSDTVTPLLVDKFGTEIAASSGDITIVTASSGEVGYTPASTATLVASQEPYTLRFRVRDGVGADVFFPNAEPFTVGVRSA